MRWRDIGEDQPHLAELGKKMLIEPDVLLAATIRRDGTPRISPVEPFVLDGDLMLSMLWGSQKAADLLHDPRILLHSIVVDRDGGQGEFKLRGTARAEHDLQVQRWYAAAVSASLGWHPEPGRFHLFVVAAEHVTVIRYDDSTGDQYVVMWPPGREFVRRGTSATSVGYPQPMREILIGGDSASQDD